MVELDNFGPLTTPLHIGSERLLRQPIQSLHRKNISSYVGITQKV